MEVGHYREGTVTVHLVDAFKKKMVWKGAIQGVVSNKNSNAQKNMQSGNEGIV
jgi:sRNA-binding regulator protein Hfq